MSEAPQKPKRKRRWFSFSLRSLLVVVTIFCVALGYWVHRANRQKAVVKWVEEHRGSVTYDFQIDEDGRLIKDPKPPGPKWVRAFLGNDYFDTVTVVDLFDSEVKDVAPLAQLEQLRYLSLDYTQVSDLSPLAGLTGLYFLNLYSTQVRDVTPLAQLTSLELLYLDATHVTQEKINVLQNVLPKCKISWTPTDKASEGN